ncbi:MAG: DedA family protein [Alphaproteobacteria bacterium]
MIEEALVYVVDFIHSLGYIGLFIATFLESTFVPIPSAATMIPAGYLAQQGQWNLGIVWIIAITGTITGSLANYALAYYLGRPFFARYGKYMMCGPERMQQIEDYFAKHGEISIFTARLLPAVRHVISFPAGLARMNVNKFIVLTGLGGGLWMTLLMFVGYFIGDNKALVKLYMPYITVASISAVSLLIYLYIQRYRRKKTGVMNGIA